MNLSKRRRKPDQDHPDVEGARKRLEQIRRQRADVDALVDALVREQRLNNFTANVTITFRGSH